MMPQLYTRDVAITAVICFIGGVGITLLVVLVCYKVFRKKKLKESKRQKEEQKGNTVFNHNANHLDEKMASNRKPWDRESMMLDTGLKTHPNPWSRADEDSSHLRCPDCSTKEQRGMGPNLMRWNNRINREMEADEEREKRRMRMVTEEERRKGNLQGILSRDISNKFNSSSQPRIETFSERPENQLMYETGRDMGSYKINVESKGTEYETLHCESCHRAYRPPEQTIRPGKFESNMRDSAAFNGYLPHHRLIGKGRNYSQFDMSKNAESRRELRNVTFDLESHRTLEQGNIQGEEKRGEEGRTSRDKEKEREKRANIQSSRVLKVKLNLNPLRKSKVHPKRKNEQDHMQKYSSRKSKEKRQQHGKDRKSGNKTKASGEKLKKSTKSRRPSKYGVTMGEEEDKEEEDKGEEKGQKPTSESEQAVQGERTHPANFLSSDLGADQSAPAVATGQVQNSQDGGVLYHGPGLVLGSAELSSKLPFSLSAAERNHTINLPLQASAGSQLFGSSLSLQGGNFLLNKTAPGFKALFPDGPANSVAAGIAIAGPNLTSGGALDSLSRQTGLGLMSATSLLANTVHANPLQISAIQTAPLQNSQAGGLALNLVANPAINPEPIQSIFQTQLLPDSSALLARLKCDPAQEPGQTGQAPQIKESLHVQAQAPTDGLSVVTSQALGSMSTEKDLSNNERETRPVAGGLTSAEGTALPAGPAAGVPGDSMQAANVSVSGIGGSSEGDAADAAVLLHQEYLLEEGDSSPRRKLRLALPEKTSSRPPTALEKKIR